MSRTRRWRALAAAATGTMAVVVVTLSGPVAGTAFAATPTTPTAASQLVPPCGDGGGPGKFEVFDNPNFTGLCQDATKPVADESDPVFNFNDKVSSVVNNTDTEMVLVRRQPVQEHQFPIGTAHQAGVDRCPVQRLDQLDRALPLAQPGGVLLPDSTAPVGRECHG